MTNWQRRVRGAIGMGLTWAVGWAIGGLLIGVTSVILPFLPWEFFFEVFDAPLPALAIPGFFGGVIFSGVLGIAGRRRRFEELSLPRFAAWGALGGLLLSLVPAGLTAVGLATANNLWLNTAMISGPFAFLGAVSASVSLMLARKAEDPESRKVGDDPDEVALTEGGGQHLVDARLAAHSSRVSREKS